MTPRYSALLDERVGCWSDREYISRLKAALRASEERAEKVEERCDVCAGEKGCAKCACGGTGLMRDAFNWTREKLFDTTARLDEARAERDRCEERAATDRTLAEGYIAHANEERGAALALLAEVRPHVDEWNFPITLRDRIDAALAPSALSPAAEAPGEEK